MQGRGIDETWWAVYLTFVNCLPSRPKVQRESLKVPGRLDSPREPCKNWPSREFARLASHTFHSRARQMNLRDQLKEILPEILPANPAEAIKGTELIRLVKYRLRQEYSDATLRYHFSIMCCDPGCPIAKVEQ